MKNSKPQNGDTDDNGSIEQSISNDFGDARLLLHLLGGGQNGQFAFRTLWENSSKPELPTKLFHFSEDSSFSSLVIENQQGSGVFFCPNETNGKGTKDSDITAIRAVFVDLDGPPLQPVFENKCPPNFVVQTSAGRYHAYWKVTEVSVAKFKELQVGLAHKFGGDLAVSNPASLMRVPSFDHQKTGATYKSHWAERYDDGENLPYAETNKSYTYDELMEVIGMPQGASNPQLLSTSGLSVEVGQRNESLYKAGCSLAGKGFSPDEILTSLQSMNAKLPEPLPDQEVSKIAGSCSTQPANEAVYEPYGPPINLNDWTVAKKYLGTVPVEEWLVENVLACAQPVVMASEGGLGKSMLALKLALDVAATGTADGETRSFFGQPIKEGGSVVFFTAEETEDAVVRRLAAIDTDGSRHRQKVARRLTIVPTSSAGGAFTISSKSAARTGSRYSSVLSQLRSISDLKLIVIDPLRTFASGDENSSEAAQVFMTEMVRLASETGAAVIALHHVSKKTQELDRNAIRGSSAIVDGARCVILLVPSKNKVAERVRKEVGDQSGGDVVGAKIVKCNGGHDTSIHYLLRGENGLLDDVTFNYYSGIEVEQRSIAELLLKAIEQAYLDGKPMTKTGKNGPYERRHNLAPELQVVSRNKMDEVIQQLIRNNEVIRGKSVKSRNGGEILMATEQCEAEKSSR